MESILEKLYNSWSGKDQKQISHDIESGIEKANVVIDALRDVNFHPHSVVDFGCGYGVVLAKFAEAFKPEHAYGIDFSQAAIAFAREHFQHPRLRYDTVPSLRVEDAISRIKLNVGERIDCVLLFDLLEHITDCQGFIVALSSMAKYFVIKLPIEKTFFDNIVWPKKEYPSLAHSNGHVREFDINDAHYFIRKLGLVPIKEGVYVYNKLKASFPPLKAGLSTRQKCIYYALKYFKKTCTFLLPRKLFLYWIGGGGYYCLATFNPEAVLTD